MNTCDTCKHFEYGSSLIDGDCHRYPPTGGVFRPVKATDWCGEWKNSKAPARRKVKDIPESAEFKVFYDEAYPKKMARDAANKAFESVPAHLRQLVIDRARGYAQFVVDEDKDMKYVKHPATWLNDGSWKDKIEKKLDSKACVGCGKPYEKGHKHNGVGKNPQYRCEECRTNNTVN